MSHYCAVSEARSKMPCMDQCDECRDYELQQMGEYLMHTPKKLVTKLIERIEKHYTFECEGGPLVMCREWIELKQRLNEAEAKLATALASERERCANVVRDYRWYELHRDCCEGNMGWLISKLESAIRAIPIGE